MRELFRPDITAVFDHYGIRIMPGRGYWSKCECPSLLHEDSHPSASVNEDIGKWNCFSCGAKGDALDVIAERENLARLIDAEQYAKDHFAGSGGDVRDQRGSGGGLLGKPATRKRARPFVPPWGRI